MSKNHDLFLQGMPEGISEAAAAHCRSLLLHTVSDLLNKTKIKDIKITVGTASLMQTPIEKTEPKDATPQSKEDNDTSIEVRAKQYEAKPPLYRFQQLVVSQKVKDELLSAIGVIRAEQKVFDEWGLRTIEPFPRTALNFHGQPGTGKTLAAHALAHKLDRPILVASYAEIESKFHGDGPKNVKAIFHAAARENAVLFIDEADSLLSKRLTNVTQGSEQAINSMRSQLLICLEQFRGVVIFATNLVENYDKAFETRVRHINFPMPDENCRREIWQAHLPLRLPLAADVSPASLAAQADDICGRDIKNAVIDAAVRVAMDGKSYVERKDLIDAITRIKEARIAVKSDKTRPLTAQERLTVESQVRQSLLKTEHTNMTEPTNGQTTLHPEINAQQDL